MITAMILVCDLQMVECKALVGRGFHSDVESCEASIEAGVVAMSEQGLVVVSGKCVEWGSPA